MKKILSSILAAILAFGIMPVSAFAEGYEYENISGTVYISVSDDDKYVTSDGAVKGRVMAYVPVDLAKLRDVKLEEHINAYDGTTFEQYYYDKDHNGKYEITLLQLYLYVLDTYYVGTSSELQAKGSPGSMYMQYGFWGHDENLLYYVNGSYPLDPDLGANMGATADKIVLRDGDFIDVTLYDNWDFYSDEKAGFHYFADKNNNVTHEYFAKAGESFELNYIRIFGNIDEGTVGVATPSAGSTVYYGKNFYDTESAKTVITDDNGRASVTFDAPGTYYLWTDGEQGAEIEAIVSSPAYCKVTVVGESGSDTVYGDINGDGAVDMDDVLEIIWYYNGITKSLTESQKKAADVNGDGAVDMDDVLEMIWFYNGTINKFSADEK